MAAEFGAAQVDLLLLSVLESGPAHGYVVISTLKQRSGGAFDLPEGTVYPALHRLEGAGLIASTRQVVGGRQRRVYSLTRTGRATLRQRRTEWERTVSHVRAVLAVAR